MTAMTTSTGHKGTVKPQISIFTPNQLQACPCLDAHLFLLACYYLALSGWSGARVYLAWSSAKLTKIIKTSLYVVYSVTHSRIWRRTLIVFLEQWILKAPLLTGDSLARLIKHKLKKRTMIHDSFNFNSIFVLLILFITVRYLFCFFPVSRWNFNA